MRNFDNKRLVLIISLIILSFFVSDFILGYLYEISHESPINLKENIEVTVTDINGEVRDDDKLLEKGEVANIIVTLPKAKRKDAYCLEMSTYHSIVEAYFDNTLIYREGDRYAMEGKMIGAIYPCIEIPDEAWGKEINIRIMSQENVPLNIDKNIMLYRLLDNKQYFNSNFFLGFYHYIVVLFVSFIITILMFINYRRNNIVKQVMWISVFCILISLWGLTYFGYYNIIFRNSWLFAQIEYMAVFYVSIPLGIYAIYKEPDNSLLKKLFTIITVVNIIFAALSTILNFNTNIHFVVLLPIMQVLILFAAIPFVYQIIRNIKNANMQTRIFNYGFLLLIISSLADIISINLEKWSIVEQGSIVSFTSIGIITFIVATIIFSFLMLFDYFEYDLERKTLLSMAYEDPMTGLANRAGCDKRLTWLEISDAIDYAIIYMDLNNLKYINDKFGHINGDKYIKEFSEALKKTFSKIGFCGRLGGDEFIVILRGEHVSLTDKYIDEFQHSINELNSRNSKFEISVAVGVAKRSENSHYSVMEVLKKADERMYIHKEDARKG